MSALEPRFYLSIFTSPLAWLKSPFQGKEVTKGRSFYAVAVYAK